MTVVYITHPDCLKHDMAYGHPESPQRLQAIQNSLIEHDIWGKLTHLEAPLASPEQLQYAHTSAHVEHVFAQSPQTGLQPLDPDTSLCPHSLAAARYAAGALVLATDAVLQGQHQKAFCAVRPPGHHATSDSAMGFCIFNNVAVGAGHALTAYKLQRVAILDFDVHHGNGTEQIFSKDRRVLYCSSHQHPHYPFTGNPSTQSNIVNAPLPGGSGSEKFRQAITEYWAPAVAQFQPELILVSAGFDAHVDDPLASINLDEADYQWVTEEICDWSAQYCEGRVISTLEGGYHLQALGESVATHVRAMLQHSV